MDNRVGEMEVFVTAAELMSFSAAGRRLQMSPSAVSKVVTRIENRLGTRLLLRSTRMVTLTPEGELYLERSRRTLADIAETEQIVSGSLVPRGLLRVNASVGFGERYLLPLIPQFLNLYPEVQLDLSLSDSMIGLIEEKTDIAIRSGEMKDSSLKARKLLQSRRVIVASPSYLDACGTPEVPDDLRGHNCLGFNFRQSLNEWPFKHPGSDEVFRLAVSGNTLANNGMIVRQLCLAGIGLGRVGRFHVQPDLDAGTLVPVLERYNPGDTEAIHAVFAGHDHMAARTRAFVEFFADHLRPEDARSDG